MDKPLRVVQVGCGGMSKVWMRVAREIPDLEVIGFVDIDLNAAKKQAAEFNLPNARISTNLGEMLDNDQVDIVFDCSIPDAHRDVTLTALQHGCHVLGEKPMADSLDHARQMAEAAQRSGKLYAVIQNRRFEPNIRRMKELIASNALGQIHTVHSDFFIAPHFGGFRDQMSHPLLLDMAIHTFDAARFLSGTDPVSVYCKEWNPPESWYAQGASAVAVFEMTGGLIYTYRGSWAAEGLPTSWESSWRLIGTKGTALWNGGDQIQAQAATHSGGFTSTFADIPVPEYNDPEKTSGHASIIRDFVDCVRTGRIPETIYSDNIKSFAMVMAAIESAESGLPVKVSV